MTMNELVRKSAESCGEKFVPQEYMKSGVMAAVLSGERADRVSRRRSFVLAVLAAVLALALSVMAAAAGVIRIPALKRLFGLEPAAETDDRDVMAPYIFEQTEKWNWQRAEENRRGADFELADPCVITSAYRAGMLGVDEIYAMFGMDAPPEDMLDAAMERYPELEENERELRSGRERFDELTGRTAAGERLSAADESFVLGYKALEQRTEGMRQELSATLESMLRYEREPESWPREIPEKYRCGSPDAELFSDRQKISELLADSKAGWGWQCWVLAMDRGPDGYKVCAAFAQLMKDGEEARLVDEDGNTVFTYADGDAFRLSDLEAEAFMERLPKWDIELRMSTEKVTTSTGEVKSYYGDNSFSVVSARRMSLLNPGNEFLYDSGYEYAEPRGERDARGELQQPFYPEALEDGRCCFDGEHVLNPEGLYSFVETYSGGGPAELTVCTPSGTMVLDAADASRLTVTITDWDFSSGAVRAKINRPTDFTIEDNIFKIHYGTRADEYPLEYELPLC